MSRKGLKRKSPRWTMLRFGNGQAAGCSLILLARSLYPSIPLMTSTAAALRAINRYRDMRKFKDFGRLR
jgi:hypothetical protein